MELKTWEIVSVQLKFALKCWVSTTTRLLNHKGEVLANCYRCSFVPNSREHFLMINILFLRMKYCTGPRLQHVIFPEHVLAQE